MWDSENSHNFSNEMNISSRTVIDQEIQLPPLNWTLGYTKFRRVVGELDNLINAAKEVTLVEQPYLWEHLETLVPEVKSIFDERWSVMRKDARSECI